MFIRDLCRTRAQIHVGLVPLLALSLFTTTGSLAAARLKQGNYTAVGQDLGTVTSSLLRTPLNLADLDSGTQFYGRRWPVVGDLQITDDGHYAAFQINNQVPGTTNTVIRATESDWKQELTAVRRVNFTLDGQQAFYVRENQLCRLKLGTSTEECLPNVSSFELRQYLGKDWLVYQSTDADHRLFIRRLTDAAAVSVASVKSFTFSSDSSTLAVLRRSSNPKEANSESIELFELANGKHETIWHGEQADSIVLSEDGSQVAFMAVDKHVHSIWSYRSGKESAEVIARDDSPELANGLALAKVDRFSSTGDRLFISLKAESPKAPDSQAVQVDIWSYKDPRLQSEQLCILGIPVSPFPNDNGCGSYQRGSYAAVLDLDTHRMLQLQHDNERIVDFRGVNDNYVIVTETHGNEVEAYWNPWARSKYYLESTQTGVRREISLGSIAIDGGANYPIRFMGPTGDAKYLVLADHYQQNFFSYEIASGVVRDITRNVPLGLNHDKSGLQQWTWRFVYAGRIEGGSSVLLYDRYDIWQVDAAGERSPINITNGYGRKNQIILRFAEKPAQRWAQIAGEDDLLLTAFDERTKGNGFYRKAMNRAGDPTQLTMGPYLYSVPLHVPPLSTFAPIKAKEASVYVVQRQSAEESPNYFWTNDWHTFHPLSNVYPEKNYNWLTSQLISWKAFDGQTTQGVLYKPENFDAHKKYPVIVFLYEIKSDSLHEYQAPRTTSDQLQFSWFVSNGYVVFTPDIHYQVGAIGKSAYNSVVSGVEYISRLPWVDKRKIALAGHSFGGFEVDYLVSHTHLFAAALAGAGVSDFVSEYLSAMSSGEGLQSFTEHSQPRMGATLWEKPEAYINNSAVFRADKVSTPLLLMNNNQDGMVGFLQQGLAWFLALRRAGKKVWMLEYDGEGHSLMKEENALDYTKKIAQFFDYYLKDAPPPMWMTRGVPARVKGIDTGLELDSSGAKP